MIGGLPVVLVPMPDFLGELADDDIALTDQFQPNTI